MKRMISLLLVLLMAMGMMIPAAMAEEETATGEGYYYVYTENGKTLNVRETPGGKVVGSLKYGSRIHVDAFVDSNWALIVYNYNNGYGKGDYAAFVNRRFLQKTKPEAKAASSSTAKKTTTTGTVSTIEELNKEFASAKKVTPYKVYSRPTRVTGWINLRWAPSLKAEVIGTYKANTSLMVIKELKNWLQVEDPETGDVGFVKKQFVSQ